MGDGLTLTIIEGLEIMESLLSNHADALQSCPVIATRGGSVRVSAPSSDRKFDGGTRYRIGSCKGPHGYPSIGIRGVSYRS